MLPYSKGLILDNTSNYGIVKTETVFGFGPLNNSNYIDDNYNRTRPLEWIFSSENFHGRSLQDEPETQLESTARAHKNKSKRNEPTIQSIPIEATLETIPIRATVEKITEASQKESKKGRKKKRKKTRHGKGKGINKCILKIKTEQGGEGGEEWGGASEGKKRKRRRGQGGYKMPKHHKKLMIPIIIGLLAAKALLISIALKALAFISVKGLMMGFFSTVMASVLSLKGVFNNNGYQNRKDEGKTQVEIIQVPSKSEDHIYYDEHYKRGDVMDPYYRNLYEDYRRGDVYPLNIPVNAQNFKRNELVDNVKGNVYEDYRRADVVPIIPYNVQHFKRNVLMDNNVHKLEKNGLFDNSKKEKQYHSSYTTTKMTTKSPKTY